MHHRPNDILSDRERRFVDAYLIDPCQSRAAARAGYSARSSNETGRRLMKRPRVVAALAKAMADRARRNRVDQDQVVQALAAVAFGNPRTLFDENGELLPLHRLPDEAAALIAELEVIPAPSDTESDTGDGPGNDEGADSGPDGRAYTVKLRTGDRLKALELLGKHLGMFSDKFRGKIGGDGDVPMFEVRFVEPDRSTTPQPAE